MKGINDSPSDLLPFIEFAGKYGPADWKLLDFMVLPNQYTNIDKTFFVNLSEIKETLKNIGVSNKDEFSVQAGGLGSPMLKIEMKNGVNVYIKDSTVGSHYATFCKSCNYFPCQDAIMALRLTANGSLQKCLYREDNLISLKPILKDTILLNRVIKDVVEEYKSSTFIKNAWKI
jgi:cyclic pyranopterin phosphate synthase